MATIAYLTRIEFGFGVISMLPDALGDLGIRRPLVVTDAGLVKSGLVERVTAGLPAGFALFDGTPSNPTEAAVEAALVTWHEKKCDGIVAIGGGPPIDLAKGVALLASHPRPLDQYAAVLGGLPLITAAVPPVVAVPTTSGTGSEVGRAALLTLGDGRKLGFISPHLIPKLALSDPDLTLGLPPFLTAATGMDALSHAIETFLSPRDNPPAEAIGLDGARRVARNLRRAVETGSDRGARREMMMAALEGGLCFQKGLGAVHALSHPLGGLAEPVLHHGTLNAILMPAVLRFNAGHVGDKYDRLRVAMDLPAGADLADHLTGLSRDIGLPTTLAAVGVPKDVLPYMAEHAVRDHSSATNPRPATAADYLGLLREAYA
jgi:4-hydroxybutyrate dehydrogenase